VAQPPLCKRQRQKEIWVARVWGWGGRWGSVVQFGSRVFSIRGFRTQPQSAIKYPTH
jgi:hypothetical protein